LLKIAQIKLLKIAQNEIAQNCSKLLKIAQNKIAQNCSKLLKIAQNKIAQKLFVCHRASLQSFPGSSLAFAKTARASSRNEA